MLDNLHQGKRTHTAPIAVDGCRLKGELISMNGTYQDCEVQESLPLKSASAHPQP
jgi:hypothetical protein